MTNDPDPAPLLSGEASLEAETRHVRGLRGGDGPLLGLAFSGGGIRSATFNLGILQALARRKMLDQFDYLSTVSGGGYIGSWLSALIRREGLAGAMAVLHPDPPGAAEAPPLRFLRRYSNYLTPKVGFSGDTLAAVATYLRNFGLNLLPLLLLGSVFVVGMYLLFKGAAVLDARRLGLDPLWLALALIMVSVTAAGSGLGTTSGGARYSLPAQPAWAWLVLVPVGIAGILLALSMAHGMLRALSKPTWMAIGAGAYSAAWVLGLAAWWIVSRESYGVRRPWDKIMVIAGTPLAGAVGGLLTALIDDALGAGAGKADLGLQEAWLAVALGSPLILLGFATAISLHIGLLRRALSHQAREWWSRLGGLMLAACLAWVLAFLLAGLAPALLLQAQGWTVEAGGLWAVLTAAGVWLAKSPLTGGEGKHRWAEIAVRVTPYVFIVGFAILLSAGVYHLFTGQFCGNCMAVGATQPATVLSPCPTCAQTAIQARPFQEILADVFTNIGRLDVPTLWLALAAGLAAFLLAGFRIDINLFSLHHFYRNRLARAYLGASNSARVSHPFTGFCPDDDLRLAELRDQRPFHIVNTTLNLSGGDELAWQTRRAASFTFTPLHCGYEYRATRRRDDAGQPVGGYRPTEQFMSGYGAYLGTAMSLSGAAASPLAGYHTSTPLAALMTVFNVRLGQWLGNTADADAWRQNAPEFGSWYLLREMAASANTRARFVYLSDGGHFENLGVYELARRRCRLIVAVDAGCDPTHGFDDLANALRKCRIDLGAEIDIQVDALRLPAGQDAGMARCQAHYAAGLIRYANGETGSILYIKASLTGEESPDILNYKANHPAFPHDTTADQNFDEDQFESYRALGLHIGDGLFGAIREAAEAQYGRFDGTTFASQVDTMASKR